VPVQRESTDARQLIAQALFAIRDWRLVDRIGDAQGLDRQQQGALGELVTVRLRLSRHFARTGLACALFGQVGLLLGLIARHLRSGAQISLLVSILLLLLRDVDRPARDDRQDRDDERRQRSKGAPADVSGVASRRPAERPPPW